MSELYDALAELKRNLESIEAHPEKHPLTVRLAFRAAYRKVEREAMCYWMGMPPGAAKPSATNSAATWKQWLVGTYVHRSRSKHYHLTDDEKATVALCGLEIEGVRKPDGDGSLDDIVSRFAVCACCRERAKMAMGQF